MGMAELERNLKRSIPEKKQIYENISPVDPEYFLLIYILPYVSIKINIFLETKC